MCDCKVLIETSLSKAVKVPRSKHALTYGDPLIGTTTVLDSFEMKGVIDYGAAIEVSGEEARRWGIESGYILVIGKRYAVDKEG